MCLNSYTKSIDKTMVFKVMDFETQYWQKSASVLNDITMFV